MYGTVIYILILLVFENFNTVFESFFNKEWLFTIILTYLSSEVLHFISGLVSKKQVFAGKIGKYIIIQLSSSISSVILTVYLAIHIYFTGIEGFSVYGTELKVFELFYIFSAILYNLFVFSYLLLNEENIIQIEQETTYRKKNEYLIQAVQNDIDPKILYASMEAIIVNLHKNENIATNIINSLSLVYRFRLENKFNELIPLNKEKEALENLIELFNYIHSDSIELQFAEVKETDYFQIIPMWLQKIVIIVIGCNIISPIDKFVISIDFNENSLILKHLWREKLLISEKGEIETIAGDFEFYTNRKMEINNNNDIVVITIPLFQPELTQEEILD